MYCILAISVNSQQTNTNRTVNGIPIFHHKQKYTFAGNEMRSVSARDLDHPKAQ